MNRLCRHWSHKFPVTLNEHDGEIELPMGRCRLVCAPDLLSARLTGDGEKMAEFQRVVADHLQRMASDGTLVIDWQ